MGEPVRMVVVPVNVFLTNSKGFPVLSRAHQLVVKQLMKFDPQFAIKGKTGERGDQPYIRYVFRCISCTCTPLTAHIQAPLPWCCP